MKNKFATLLLGTSIAAASIDASADGNPYDTAPSWSADGKHVYFYSYRHGPAELYRMDPHGNHQTRLTNTEFNEWWPFATGSANNVIVASDRDSGGAYKGGNLFLLDLHSGHMENLTNEPEGRWAIFGDIARDANLMIYAAADAISGPDYEISLIDLNTLEVKPYDDDPAHSNTHPTISADGSIVAYSSKRDGQTGIYLNDLSGQNERLLMTVDGGLPLVRLSPDGSKLAFNLTMSVRTVTEKPERMSEREIFIVNTDGTGLRRITRSPGSDHGVSWSPDGKTLTFASYRFGPADIFAVDIDGSNERNLTRTSTKHTEGH